jgi:hypothetical protein
MERYTDTISGEELYVQVGKGYKYYYKDKSKTILHRIDGPAFEHTDGNEAWYVNGKRHRLDGPAYSYAKGGKAWYVNGKLHRLDGPAIKYFNGNKAWFVNDVFILEEDHKDKMIKRME